MSIFIALLFWGFNVVLMKLFLLKTSYIVLGFYKILFSFIFTYFYMLYKKDKVINKDIAINIMVGLFMYYINTILVFYSQMFIKGTSIALFHSISSVIIIFYSYIFLFKKITLNNLKYIFAIIIALLVSCNFIFELYNKSFIVMITGLLIYNLGYILLEKFKVKRCLSALFIQLLSALIVYIIHISIFCNNISLNLSLNDVVLFVLISGFGFMFIQNTYFKYTKKIGNINTSKYFALAPVFIYFLSILFLNNDILVYELIGLIILIISVIQY